MPTYSCPDARFRLPRAVIATVVAALFALLQCSAQTPEAPPQHHLIVDIVEGEGAINNIRQRTAREPIVEVQDENHRPVAGAVVVFTVSPSNGGAGATFVGGSQTAEVETDSAGRAVARGFHPNTHPGQFQIRVTATAGGLVGTALITQRNVGGGGGTTSRAGGLGGGKLALIIVLAAGAAAGGAVAALHGGGHGGTTAAATSITPGTPVVGAP